MFQFGQGDLFRTEAQTLAHGVNCRGMMGAGIALEFKRQFPDMFQAYRNACIRGQLHPGQYHIFDLPDGRKVLNLATQESIHGAHLKYVREALRSLVEDIEDLGIKSIAIPQIGAGYGGLQWEDVRKVLKEEWGKLSIPIFVVEHFIRGKKFKPFGRIST